MLSFSWNIYSVGRAIESITGQFVWLVTVAEPFEVLAFRRGGGLDEFICTSIFAIILWHWMETSFHRTEIISDKNCRGNQFPNGNEWDVWMLCIPYNTYVRSLTIVFTLHCSKTGIFVHRLYHIFSFILHLWANGRLIASKNTLEWWCVSEVVIRSGWWLDNTPRPCTNRTENENEERQTMGREKKCARDASLHLITDGMVLNGTEKCVSPLRLST